MKNSFIYTVALFPLISCSEKQELVNPNIIFILADDLGYGDIASLNNEGKIKTPNVDRLVAEGVTFTDAHSSSAVSTPTRYGVLTGRYNWRSTLKQGVLGVYNAPLIAKGRTTMPMMLKACGYETGCFGKWHLGMNFPTIDGSKAIDTPDEYTLDFSKEITDGPVDRGFDYFFGVDAPNYPPYCFIENRHTLGNPSFYYPKRANLDSRAGRGLEDWNMSNILPSIITKANEFIEKKTKEGKPFFMYLPLTSPHTPIVPTRMYEGKSCLNLYADFVMETDYAVGRILKKLDELGIADNTIVVFTSDNGCSPQANFSELGEKGHDPSYIFRGMKSDLFEGGHHVPCIVRWPEKAKPHTIEQTICLTDFYRTFASIVGYDVKDTEAEDSYDISSLLYKDEETEILREATVHHSINGSFAIRKGNWKLFMTSNSGGWSDSKPSNAENSDPNAIQLYNLKNDPTEDKDISNKYPEVVNELRSLLVDYILNGRSTPGKIQNNDGTRIWKQIKWIETDNYR